MTYDVCWLPVVEDCNVGSPTASRYFGRPWLAHGEKWPVLGGYSMLFVLQLDIISLPQPMRDLLGGRGLFQLFYPQDEAAGDTWEGEGILARTVFPEEVPGGAAEIPSSVARVLAERANGDAPWKPLRITGWREMPDFQHGEEELSGGHSATDETDDDEDEDGDENDDENSCMQGDKLGGWPFWTQAAERLKRLPSGMITSQLGPEATPDAGEAMVPFLQLDAGCFFEGQHGEAHAPQLFAGDGTLHVNVLPSDPTMFAVRWACT